MADYNLEVSPEEQKEIDVKKQDFSKRINSMNRGIQILREYFWFDNFEQEYTQRIYQKQTSFDGLIRKEQFRQALSAFKSSNSQYFLTPENIEQIIEQSPKTLDKKQIYWTALKNAILESQKPMNSYSMVNVYMNKTGLSQSKAEEKLYYLKNTQFFNQKEEINFINEEFYDLNHLDIEVAKKEFEENDEKIREEFQKKINERPMDEQLKKQLQEYKQSKKHIRLNNENILHNLDIQFSKDFLQVIIPPSRDISIGEANSEYIVKQLKELLKKAGYNTNYILFDDFVNFFKDESFFYKKSMKNKDQAGFKDLSRLSKQALQLIYYRIWESNNFNEFTIYVFSDFLTQNKNRKKRELMKKFISEQEKRRLMKTVDLETPRLFTEIIKIAYTYGLTFLLNSFNPLRLTQIGKENLVEYSNIRIFFTSLQITFNDQELGELNKYLANERVLVLDNYDQQKFLLATMYLDLDRLKDFIKRETKDIALLEETKLEQIRRSDDQARNTIQSRIIQAVVSRMKSKIQIYKDENDLIEEITLRKIIHEQFSEITAYDLDMIFSRLKHSSEPSKFQTQRKIYVQEFYDFLLKGPIFELKNQGEVADQILEQEEVIKKEVGEQQQQQKQQQQQIQQQQFQTQNQNFIAVPEENYRIHYDIPKDGGFIFNPPIQAFKVVKYDDKEIILEFGNMLLNKITIEPNQNSLEQLELLDIACLEFRNLCKKYDTENEGQIKYHDFKHMIQINFHELGNSKINFLCGIARSVSGVQTEDQGADDIAISYSYFALHIHKYLSMTYFFNNNEKKV